jgi:hypothetical protein
VVRKISSEKKLTGKKLVVGRRLVVGGTVGFGSFLYRPVEAEYSVGLYVWVVRL